MPDLRFESLRNVTLMLGNVKLQLAGTKIVPNNDIPANHVVDQNPPPLTSVREGTAVTLTLSKGPPANVRCRNFVNMGIDDARDAAQTGKVHLGQIVWTPFGLTVRRAERSCVKRRRRPAHRSFTSGLAPGERGSAEIRLPRAASPRDRGDPVARRRGTRADAGAR